MLHREGLERVLDRLPANLPLKEEGINEETVTARTAKEINFQLSNGDEEGCIL